MKKPVIGILFILLLFSAGQKTSAQSSAQGPVKFSAGLMAGYNRGFGLQTNVTAYNFTKDFPFELRLGMGYTFLNPGDAEDARRIFINDATNGTPEKKGRSFDLRFDFLLSTPLFGIDHSYIVFGPRFSTFRGNFAYIGGNEDFDVTSQQWGLGGGLESHFTMTGRIRLVFNVGLDHYFPSTLTGHDTSYSPDNDNVNPRNDNQNGDEPFTYRDADKAVRQPVFMPHAMIGIQVSL